jgi:Zn-dependent peptidase ImmA (M78 family)
MGTQEIGGLESIRTRLVKLSVATAAQEAGLSVERLRAIEHGSAASVLEIERLGAVYGVDPDALWDDTVTIADDDGVVVLTRLDEFAEVSEHTRVRILRAANAARDLLSVRSLLDDNMTPARLSAPADVPYAEGAEIAKQLRRQLGLGVGPIHSVRDLVATSFPWIGLMYARLGSVNTPAGLSFVDSTRGPAIVLNLDGKNANPLVRRVSLAHELCHMLVDAHQGSSLAMISGFLSDTGLAREQRANGFAVRLLCPETVVQRLSQVREEDAARVLIEEYGMPYAAARLYLHNEAKTYLPANPPEALGPSLEPRAEVLDAEAPRGTADFPLTEVPVERRGVLAHAASRAYAAGLLARDAYARMLGVTPAASVESVLGYFELDVPVEPVSP